MKKFSNKASMCSLLKEASKSAKGTGALYVGKGQYCLWGEAARLMGVSPIKMRSEESFKYRDGSKKVKASDFSWFWEVPEAGTWDTINDGDVSQIVHLKHAGAPKEVIEKTKKDLIAKLVARLCKRFKKRTVGHFRQGLVALGLLKLKKGVA